MAVLGHGVPERGQEGFQLVRGVQARHLSRTEEAVDELEEGGIYELVVFDEEDPFLSLDASLLHHLK